MDCTFTVYRFVVLECYNWKNITSIPDTLTHLFGEACQLPCVQPSLKSSDKEEKSFQRGKIRGELDLTKLRCVGANVCNSTYCEEKPSWSQDGEISAELVRPILL